MSFFNTTTPTTLPTTAWSTLLQTTTHNITTVAATAATATTTTAAAINDNETTSRQGVKDLPLGASLLFINFCIIVFNVLTIAVIVRFRTKNAIDIFVLALATTDLIKGLIPVPMSVYIYLTDWYLVEGNVSGIYYDYYNKTFHKRSEILCTIYGGVQKFMTY